jgi:basic amino acid/polyamine antiporter, APA family
MFVVAPDEEGMLHLKRTLTSLDLIFLGIGVVIGAGLFTITGIAASQHAGPAIVLSFIIAAIGCTFAGLCYSEMATMIPVSGSVYTYAYATMGELIAWMIGWSLVLEYAIGAAAVSISWSGYMMSFLEDYNIKFIPELTASAWQPIRLKDGTTVYGWINLPALMIVIVISALLIKGIRESALVNSFMVVIKVLVVLIFIGFGFFYINPENYHPFIPPNTGEFGSFGFSGVMRAAGTVFFAYVGFDSISTAVQETKNPQKSIPIGIIGSLAICTVLYILFSLVMTGLVYYPELNVSAPVSVAIDKTPYIWLHKLVEFAILCGLTSVILVLLLGQSRIFYVMSKDGLLPPLFSHLHPLYRTPWYCNLTLMVLVGVLGAFAPLEVLAHMTSIGTLLAFVIVCICVLILRYRHPEIPRAFKTPLVPYIPLLGIFVCLSMMISLGMDNWLRLIIWLAIGLVIYFGYGIRHSKEKRQ